MPSSGESQKYQEHFEREDVSLNARIQNEERREFELAHSVSMGQFYG